MNINIIPPDNFNTTPWKNGKGETTELAISDGGDIDDFDWRISIATVSEDGPFSDFKGLERNLVLIKGNGISLHHDHQTTDRLDALLKYSNFDGGKSTVGTLLSGPIKDFNIMAADVKYRTKVSTYVDPTDLVIEACDYCFVFGLTQEVVITDLSNNKVLSWSEGSLMQASTVKGGQLNISGEKLIVVRLLSK